MDHHRENYWYSWMTPVSEQPATDSLGTCTPEPVAENYSEIPGAPITVETPKTQGFWPTCRGFGGFHARSFGND